MEEAIGLDFDLDFLAFVDETHIFVGKRCCDFELRFLWHDTMNCWAGVTMPPIV
jgi:hypothetical protein